jgi:hypothetical protein
VPTDGLDTDLARRLHTAGVDLELLRECLQVCRERRLDEDPVTLGILLLERGVEARVIDQALAERPQEAAAAPSSTGPYRVVRELARGGMGVVYEAVHDQTGARVALKQILGGRGLQGEERARFQREAQVLAALRHPGIVAIHGAELDVPSPYMVQELVTGGTLKSKVAEQGPLPAQACRSIVAKLCDALAYTHGEGVLHRDLKPQNVLFDELGEPRLADFGLATGHGEGRLTHTGEILGTPAYMAPEQATDAKRVDARADVYGVGALLYYMLTGQAPFAGAGGVFQTLNRVLSEPPRAPRELRPEISADLEQVCLRALAKRPEDRFESVAALAAAAEGEPTASGPASRGLLLAAAGAVGVVALGAALTVSGRAASTPREAGSAPTVSPSPSVLGSLEEGLTALAARQPVQIEAVEELLLRRLEGGETAAGIDWSPVPPEPRARLLDLVALFEGLPSGRFSLFRDWELRRRELQPVSYLTEPGAAQQLSLLQGTQKLIQEVWDPQQALPTAATRVALDRALDTLARRVVSVICREPSSSMGPWFENVEGALDHVTPAVRARVYLARAYQLSYQLPVELAGRFDAVRAFWAAQPPAGDPRDPMFEVVRGVALARLPHWERDVEQRRTLLEQALRSYDVQGDALALLSLDSKTMLQACFAARLLEQAYVLLEGGEDPSALLTRVRALLSDLRPARRHVAAELAAAAWLLDGGRTVEARAELAESESEPRGIWLRAQIHLVEGRPEEVEKLLLPLFEGSRHFYQWMPLVECLRHASALLGKPLPNWPDDPRQFDVPWQIPMDEARYDEPHWWPGGN